MSSNSSSSADCQLFRSTIIPKLYGYDLSQPANCCDNSTVVCDNSTRITKIIYSDFKLSGFIPQELGQLSRLETLYLDNNALKGPIPVEMGNLKSLKYLHLEFNQLDGQIPSQLDGMTAAVDVFLNDNSLQGQVPPSLGNLKNLTQLYLQNNYLLGSLPFQSSTPNSVFRFAPQKTLPPAPEQTPFNPIILPALLSTAGFIIIIGFILWTIYRRRRVVSDQYARDVSGSTLASNQSIRTSKSSIRTNSLDLVRDLKGNSLDMVRESNNSQNDSSIPVIVVQDQDVPIEMEDISVPVKIEEASLQERDDENENVEQVHENNERHNENQ